MSDEKVQATGSVETQESEPKQGRLFEMIQNQFNDAPKAEPTEAPTEEAKPVEDPQVDATPDVEAVVEAEPSVPVAQEPQSISMEESVRKIMKEELANAQPASSPEPVQKPVYELVQESNDLASLETAVKQQYGINEHDDISPGHMMKYLADLVSDALDHSLRPIKPVMEDVAPYIQNAKQVAATQERTTAFYKKNPDFGDYSKQVEAVINEQYPQGMPEGTDVYLTAETIYTTLKKSKAVDQARQKATNNQVEAKRRVNGSVSANTTAAAPKKSSLRRMIERAGS